ncbi:hypothetical protein GCM10010909_10180 [Acidocella aquatica]|uniref:ABC-2 type transporter transmembrane domain-containing protein n=1 Tax=Acidocella aquatica TaxID=1922313 RepID=A0ABQ6A3X7_9PROT|nr:ABC transporter permease [Acidocella aquatica]GLR66338.1 hypothetical protein GCM10010909_10180 [Acidocella aquatica]
MEGGLFAAEIEAVRRDRRNLPALRAQAEILFAGGQRDEAVALLRTADALAPGDFLTLRILSGFLAAMGQLEEAGQLAARAVELAPGAAEAQLHLASLQLAQQQYAAAIAHLAAHVSAGQATAAGWHMLAVAMAASGQPNRAIEAIRHAVEIEPANAGYRLHLASLLTARARYGDALTELGIAATLFPGDARIARAASGNHEALGDLSAAYQEAARARDLAPGDAEIERHYSHLAKQIGFSAAPVDEALAQTLAGWSQARARKQVRARPRGWRRLVATRGRVIHALVLRDMRTRYSRAHLGYLWAIFEPVSHLLTLGVMFALINQGPPPVGTSLFEYYCTGLLPYLMFSHIANEVMSARAASGAVLMLPNVRTTDVIFSKTFLNLMTEIVVGMVVFAAFGAAGYRAVPAHLFTCAAAILLLAGLAMGIGAVNMVVQNFFHSWETVFASIVRLLYFSSGIYYSPISMPDYARGFLEWNPILQGVEIFRSGFYPEYHPFWIDARYLTAWVLLSLLLGLGLEQVLRKRLRQLL